MALVYEELEQRFMSGERFDETNKCGKECASTQRAREVANAIVTTLRDIGLLKDIGLDLHALLLVPGAAGVPE